MNHAPTFSFHARLFAGLCLASAAVLPAPASAERLECSVLLEQIEGKLQAHGVRHYRLEVVATEEQADGKVIGTCNGGTQKVIYTRTPPAPAQKTRATT